SQTPTVTTSGWRAPGSKAASTAGRGADYPGRVNAPVLVLGAGFGGLELCSRLATELGGSTEVTLIDQSDSFVFGFSKFDLMFGRKTEDEVRVPYSELAAPGVRFRQETITSIEPESGRVTTDLDTYEAEILVVALGADYDVSATPGLVAAGYEFYTVTGALGLREPLEAFDGGTA